MLPKLRICMACVVNGIDGAHKKSFLKQIHLGCRMHSQTAVAARVHLHSGNRLHFDYIISLFILLSNNCRARHSSVHIYSMNVGCWIQHSYG